MHRPYGRTQDGEGRCPERGRGRGRARGRPSSAGPRIENTSGKSYATQGAIPKHWNNHRRGTHNHKLTIDTLQNLYEKDTREIVFSLCQNTGDFRKLLNEDSTRFPNDIILILRVISRASTCTSIPQNVISLLSTVSASDFLTRHVPSRLSAIIAGILQGTFDSNSESIIRHVIVILKAILQRTPSLFIQMATTLNLLKSIVNLSKENGVGMDDEICKEVCNLDEDREEELKNIRAGHMELTLKGQSQTAGQKFDVQSLTPPDDFHDIPTIPGVADIVMNRRPFIRPNIAKGSFKSIDHYLDVQYRLLREDFVSPLRAGIKEYLQNQALPRSQRSRPSDVRIYENVYVLTPTCSRNEGICHTIRLDTNALRRVRWHTSKRLIYGSLVCLSRNNFRTILFATVANREIRDLERGITSIKFLHLEDVLNELDDQAFVMVESTAFFESYRYVLDQLKEFDGATLPFARHVVFCEKDVEIPRYLMSEDDDDDDLQNDVNGTLEDLISFDRNSVGGMSAPHHRTKDGYHYDFSPILKAHKPIQQMRHSNHLIPQRRHTEHLIPILELDSWPTADDLGLDDSQVNALKTALTKEFAIIQGPPGTGKTYLGLKIVQMLLCNHRFWSQPQINDDVEATGSPILVVCYTNHALDQFLEGILTFLEHGIVRIGSRSKSEVLEPFNIARLRDRSAGKHLFDDIANCSEEIMKAFSNVENGRKFGMGENVLPCLPRNHIESLMQCPTQGLHAQYIIAALHYWLLEKILDEKEPDVKDPDKVVNGQVVDGQMYTNGSALNENIAGKANDGNDTIDVQAETDFINELRQLDDQQTSQTKTTDDTITAEDLEFWHKLFEQFNQSPYKKSKQRRFGGKRDIRKWKRYHSEILQDFLTDTASMTEAKAQSITNIWSLHLADRWRIYRHWFYKWTSSKSVELAAVIQKYDNLIGQVKEHREEADRQQLSNAKVIGMTTTGASKYGALLKMIKPKIVIVEEAAEVLESHIITSLSSECQHLILIGDHEQLRPNPTVFELNTKFNLGISLFERMVKNGLHCEQLHLQHRMRPEIAEMMKFIYDNLRNHDSVYNYDDIHGVHKNIFFVEHQQEETFMEDIRSFSSSHEANFLVALCQYFLKQGYEPSQITILTMYTAQLIQLKNLMPKSSFYGVRVCPVDNFQGEENDIILLSLVRSNPQGKMGFLNITNRVCVALSRARMGFYCIGNFKLLGKNRLWGEIIKHLQEKGSIGRTLKLFCRNHPDTVTECFRAEDFKAVPEGGCNLRCECRLDCGHACRLFCHPKDANHKEYKCNLPCARECDGGHLCKLRCYKDCGKCMIKVEKVVPRCSHIETMFCHVRPEDHRCLAKCRTVCERHHPCPDPCYAYCHPCKIPVAKTIPVCGHTQMVPCHQNPESFHCKAPCPKSCEKGHPCKQLCHESCKPCNVKIEKTIPACGHTQMVPCHQDPTTFSCMEPCPKKCIRGHPCPLDCHQGCTDCQVKIPKIMPSCHHVQIMKCSKRRRDHLCKEPCEKIFACGHHCTEKCSDSCPEECHVNVTRKLPMCGHTQSMECSEDVNLYNCGLPCERSLPCGHPCTKKCGEVCNVACKVQVLHDDWPCGHKVRGPCHLTPDQCIEICGMKLDCEHDCKAICHRCQIYGYGNHPLCEMPCSKKLACGHNCTNLCHEECTSGCLQSVERKIQECGHTVKMACCEEKTLLCQKYCGYALPCGHRCRGKCGICRSLGSHNICSQQCNRRLLCGHTCRSLCHLPCGPCPARHNQVCEHGTRGRLCHLQCAWNCKHHQCSRKCYEPCDRPPCDHPCHFKLKCRHKCVGVCSEPCPQLCRVCNKQRLEAAAAYYGRRYSDDMRFIQLSCGHVFTVEDVDRLMMGISSVHGGFQVGLKTCPSCYKPIEGCRRYNSVIKDVMVSIEEMDRKDAMFIDPAREYIRKLISTHISQEHRPSFEAICTDVNTLERVTQTEKHIRWYRTVSVWYVLSCDVLNAILNLKEYGSNLNDDYLEKLHEKVESVINLIGEWKTKLATCKYDPTDPQQDEQIHEVLLRGFVAVASFKIVESVVHKTPDERLDRKRVFSSTTDATRRKGLSSSFTHFNEVFAIDDATFSLYSSPIRLIFHRLERLRKNHRQELSDLDIPVKEELIDQYKFKSYASGVWFKCGRGHLFYHRLQQIAARHSQQEQSVQWPTCKQCVLFPADEDEDKTFASSSQEKAGKQNTSHVDRRSGGYYSLQQSSHMASQVQTPMSPIRFRQSPVPHPGFYAQQHPRWEKQPGRGNNRGTRPRGGRSGQRGQRGKFHQAQTDSSTSGPSPQSSYDNMPNRGAARGRSRSRGKNKGRRR
ncbi:NFX1-type zinc finger-containing protein 1-like [Glandiceps talaboti]